jgi:hypothetical protein
MKGGTYLKWVIFPDFMCISVSDNIFNLFYIF